MVPLARLITVFALGDSTCLQKEATLGYHGTHEESGFVSRQTAQFPQIRPNQPSRSRRVYQIVIMKERHIPLGAQNCNKNAGVNLRAGGEVIQLERASY